MHYVKAKGILSSQNGMNLYWGCSHGCIYCDSRSSCYRIDHSFEDIEVKENAIELLEDALRRKRKRCMIGTGSMSDPYMPLELRLEYTRKALLIIEKYGDRYEVPSPHSDELMRLFHHTCEQNGIMHDNDEIFAYLHRFEEKEPFGQISLWEL